MSTAALAPDTGNPPAIRWEDLQDWSTLADNIDAALKMGGDQGMDLLLGIITDWCRVVDEINSAYQICCDLAGQGLRDEAIVWHAEGFFDIADRLDPDRPGWEAWEQALTGQGVILPSLDADAKALTNQIFDDMKAMHINGQVLEQEVKALRRNMLARGDLSERLSTLDRLQELDPTAPNWQDMLKPYRRKRAGQINKEVTDLVKAEDVRALCRINAEIERQNWDDELDAETRASLTASIGWEKAEIALQRLRHEVTELVVRCREGQNTEYGSMTYQNAIHVARKHRERIVAVWNEMNAGLATAEECPRIRRIIRKREITETAKSIEQGAKNESVWLQEQDSFEQVQRKFSDLDDTLLKVLNKVPSYAFPNFEDYKRQSRKWLSKAEELLIYARRLCKHAPMIPKESEELIARFVQTEQFVRTKRKSVKKQENMLLLGILSTVGFIAIAAIIAVVVSQNT